MHVWKSPKFISIYKVYINKSENCKLNKQMEKGSRLFKQKDSYKTVRDNKISKVLGHKINTQKSVEFLCINMELSETEIKKIIPFPTVP